jgi:hypothetical protein
MMPGECVGDDDDVVLHELRRGRLEDSLPPADKDPPPPPPPPLTALGHTPPATSACADDADEMSQNDERDEERGEDVASLTTTLMPSVPLDDGLLSLVEGS